MSNGRITIYGCSNSTNSYEVRDSLTRNCSDYDWVELNADKDSQRLAGVAGLTSERVHVTR